MPLSVHRCQRVRRFQCVALSACLLALSIDASLSVHRYRCIDASPSLHVRVAPISIHNPQGYVLLILVILVECDAALFAGNS